MGMIRLGGEPTPAQVRLADDLVGNNVPNRAGTIATWSPRVYGFGSWRLRTDARRRYFRVTTPPNSPINEAEELAIIVPFFLAQTQ